MNKIVIPETYNYIAVFLTMRCNLTCSYCINTYNSARRYGTELTGEQWIEALNRIQSRSDLPITLQGGEPTLHKDFYKIVNGVTDGGNNVDLLTNGQFDVEQFTRNIGPNEMKRDAPYASIRFSYHPETMDFRELVRKVEYLDDKGYSVGIWAVDHPLYTYYVEEAKALCKKCGIDFRTKEFLGMYEGKMYGKYRYVGACSGEKKNVMCSTTELLIGPDGSVYRCHSDLYNNRKPIGNITDHDFSIEQEYRPCSNYGTCNPCDIKVKTNRFQEYGHTSVDILEGPDEEDGPWADGFSRRCGHHG